MIVVWIWRGYGRKPVAIVVVFQIALIWGIAVPMCMFLDNTLRREELGVSAVILLATAATFYVIARRYALWNVTRPILGVTGEVLVFCPRCRYSMVGLHEARCPECGERYTLDELIRRQNYTPNPTSR